MHHSRIACVFAVACTVAATAPHGAMADSHVCGQLRASVENSIPPSARELPYDQLDCSGIAELYLLLTSRRFDSETLLLDQRIEAVFRRLGLVD